MYPSPREQSVICNETRYFAEPPPFSRIRFILQPPRSFRGWHDIPFFSCRDTDPWSTKLLVSSKITDRLTSGFCHGIRLAFPPLPSVAVSPMFRTFGKLVFHLALGVSILPCGLQAQTTKPSVKIGSFMQEAPERYLQADGQSLSDTRNLYIDSQNRLHVRTANQHLSLGLESTGTTPAWKKESPDSNPAVNQVLVNGKELLLATKEGVVVQSESGSKSLGLGEHAVESISRSTDGRIAAATKSGLFEYAQGKWTKLEVFDDNGRQWAARDVRAVVYDSKSQLWFGQLAGLGCRTADGWRFYEGKDGLPYSDFTCAAADSAGRVWFGTKLGLVGFDQGKFVYRQGPRFMPGDEIRAIAVANDGTPWLATDRGVGALKRKPMRLSEKAALYEDQIDKYIKRTPFGYTSEVGLNAPNDFSKINYHDSDNDGLWTAMYGASQCFAVAVTGSERHRAAAKQAFEAIRFLQTVTQGGSHSPPRGYIARTILPTDGPNPNDGRLEQDRDMKARRDRGWKVYEPRWPTSADGKWYWKSDTSSDELDGHYFFLPLYYDLVADSEEEKERVRQVVRDLTDHLISHQFQLVDIDGTPTRWGMYNPDKLNQDPQWWEGRGLNSLSILAYLVVAEHVTGDAKYADALEQLRKKHSYEANAMVAKVQYGPGTGNQSDDEMAIMNFYSLLKYTKDEQLQRTMRYSMFTYWSLLSRCRNPFFHFAYAHHGLGRELQTTHSQIPLDPWGDWLEDSVDTLTGFPLDRLNWPQKNSHRLDIVGLQRAHDEPPGTERRPTRGYRVDGKVLPVENRHFNHWNTDSWRLDYSGSGKELASGTVFLLPYYMGRYHGFIQEE